MPFCPFNIFFSFLFLYTNKKIPPCGCPARGVAQAQGLAALTPGPALIGSVHLSLPKLESTKNRTQKKNAHPTNASSTMQLCIFRLQVNQDVVIVQAKIQISLGFKKHPPKPTVICTYTNQARSVWGLGARSSGSCQPHW